MPETPQHTETIQQGVDFSLQIQWKVNGVAVDMTGYTVAADLRVGSVRNPTKLADFDWAFVNAATGIFKITLPDTTTEDFVAPSNVADVKAYAPDGTEYKILSLRMPVEFTATVDA